MQNKFLIFCCLLLTLNPGILRAVEDVFTGHTVETGYHRLEKILPEVSFVNNRVEFSCLELRSIDNKTSGYNADLSEINESIKALCLSYLHDEAAYLDIQNVIKERMEVLKQIVQSKSRFRTNPGRSLNEPPRLIKLRSSPVSMVNNNLFIELKFEFEITYRRSQTKQIDYSRYYVVDLKNSSINRFIVEPDKEQSKNIMELLRHSVNDYYYLSGGRLHHSQTVNLLDAKSKRSSLMGKPATDTIPVPDGLTDKSKEIDLSEAKFIWFGWGIMVSFQNFTESSLLFDGRPFNIFLPYEKALKVASILPEFSFVTEIGSVETNLRNINIPEISSQHRFIRGTTDVLDLFKLNPVEVTPKALEMVTFSINRTNRRRFSSKSEILFNSEGQELLRKHFHSRKGHTATTFYEYAENSNLMYQIKINEDDKESYEYEAYFYDQQNNLAEVKKHSKYSKLRKEYYFYRGNYVYRYQHKVFNRIDGRFTRMKLTEESYCLSRICYLYDEDGTIMGTTQGQVGRDSLGRVIESYFGSNRYYFYYDSAGRLKRSQNFDNHRILREKEYYYRNGEALPYRSTNTHIPNSRTLEKLYNWEFYE